MPEPQKKVRSKSDAAAEAFFVEEAEKPSAERSARGGNATPDWLETDYSGQLAVDVYQTPSDVVIVSTIAGITIADLDVAIRNDTVTIRGVRRPVETVADEQYFYRECYWGGFSRSIVLPVEVRADKASAILKHGVLTVRLPKADAAKAQVLTIQEIEDEE